MFTAEVKNSIFTLYDVDNSFIKVSVQTTAKPNSVYVNEYNSTKYNTMARKVALNLNHYIVMENINNNSRLLFSKRELENFLDFARESFKIHRTGSQNTFRYVPEITKFYPNILIVFASGLVQIWSEKEETTLVAHIEEKDFIILMSTFKDCNTNFINLSASNSILYGLLVDNNSIKVSDSNVEAQVSNPFIEEETSLETEAPNLSPTDIKVGGGYTYEDTGTELNLGTVQESKDELQGDLNLDLDNDDSNPNDIPDFLK